MDILPVYRGFGESAQGGRAGSPVCPAWRLPPFARVWIDVEKGLLTPSPTPSPKKFRPSAGLWLGPNRGHRRGRWGVFAQKDITRLRRPSRRNLLPSTPPRPPICTRVPTHTHTCTLTTHTTTPTPGTSHCRVCVCVCVCVLVCARMSVCMCVMKHGRA